MEIIDHGNGIIEYKDAIDDPYQLIANIEELDSDPIVYDVLPPFSEWAEGFVQPDGVWRAVNVKGRSKIFKWTDSSKRPELEPIRELVSQKVLDPIWFPLRECVTDYANRAGVKSPKLVTRNIDLRVYATGETLGPHEDTNHSGPFTHYSLVIYLNDDYEGGEIAFTNLGLKIKPKAGTIVAFPATTLHESLEVTKGEKWHSPCFWYGEISLVTSGKEEPNPFRFMQ